MQLAKQVKHQRTNKFIVLCSFRARLVCSCRRRLVCPRPSPRPEATHHEPLARVWAEAQVELVLGCNPMSPTCDPIQTRSSWRCPCALATCRRGLRAPHPACASWRRRASKRAPLLQKRPRPSQARPPLRSASAAPHEKQVLLAHEPGTLGAGTSGAGQAGDVWHADTARSGCPYPTPQSCRYTSPISPLYLRYISAILRLRAACACLEPDEPMPALPLQRAPSLSGRAHPE